MKNVIKSILSLSIILLIGAMFTSNSSFAASNTYPGKSLTPKAGDIIITSKRTTSHYTGHAMIVTDKLKVAEIAGPNKHPRELTFAEYKKAYPTVKSVVRIQNTKIATKAGAAARQYVADYKTATYSVTSHTDLRYKKVTYCSKMVWQAYWAAGVDLRQHVDNRTGAVTHDFYSPILPYDLQYPSHIGYIRY
ncbi:hypothetical protein SAMN04487776_1614 [Priestia megaterium]|uniref:hypothetical protein n=1 Tax=Priestia sp. AB TaxID=3020890 RepID=UPI0008F03D53|nr:hypothetical protein [Priestia sp. AB]MDC0706785.1 hypothetical protein [Priestia sp. AB]SFH65545.1 hypothetical protein SAMN04487776_1614 [Priestia megaterium]